MLSNKYGGIISEKLLNNCWFTVIKGMCDQLNCDMWCELVATNAPPLFMKAYCNCQVGPTFIRIENGSCASEYRFTVIGSLFFDFVLEHFELRPNSSVFVPQLPLNLIA